MYLGLHLGSMLSPKFLKSWKLMHIKNSIFNTATKLKLLAQIIAFSQTAKLKCRKIQKLLIVNFMSRKLLALKYAPLKKTSKNNLKF